jgi:[ribosomal protein S5]-alanine N-acetyltransferase
MDFQPLETDRLRIRRLVPGDTEDVAAYLADPEVTTYLPEGRLTTEQTLAFVTENVGDEWRALALLRRGNDRLIGHMLFHPWFAPRTFEVGWVLDRRFHGNGYASEAAAALLGYGFKDLGLHRIIATCQPENVASYRVMEKIGMRREGWFRKCIHRGDNTWWDELFYALLAEEWFAD